MKWLSNFLAPKSPAITAPASVPALGSQIFPAHVDYHSVARGWENDSQEQPDSDQCRQRFEGLSGNYVVMKTFVAQPPRFDPHTMNGEATHIEPRQPNGSFNSYIPFRAV